MPGDVFRQLVCTGVLGVPSTQQQKQELQRWCRQRYGKAPEEMTPVQLARSLAQMRHAAKTRR